MNVDIPEKATPAQIKNRGLEALAEALGPVGMARFLQQFDAGSWDYTRDRTRWLQDLTVKKAVAGIKRRRERPRR